MSLIAGVPVAIPTDFMISMIRRMVAIFMTCCDSNGFSCLSFNSNDSCDSCAFPHDFYDACDSSNFNASCDSYECNDSEDSYDFTGTRLIPDLVGW